MSMKVPTGLSLFRRNSMTSLFLFLYDSIYGMIVSRSASEAGQYMEQASERADELAAR